jgi:hypothetical protein
MTFSVWLAVHPDELQRAFLESWEPCDTGTVLVSLIEGLWAVATVADALGDKQSETAPLDDFLQRAASFGDRPVRRRRAHGNAAAAAPLHRRPRRNARPASDETAP